jgi:hypothetical protein
MNGAPDTWQLVATIARAPSFWEQTVPLFAAALVLFAGAAGFVVSRYRASAARLRALSRHESGSAEAMDFVLTFPILLFVTFMFVQLLLGAHASLVVHYSAYSAARAARTVLFDMSVSDVNWLRVNKDVTDTLLWQPSLMGRQGRVRELANTAARLALMNAVPTAVKYNAAPQGAGLIMWRKTVPLFVRGTATRKKAAYAFADGNAKVDVQVINSYQNLAVGRAARGEQIVAIPVRARVTFRYPLVMPAVSRVFGTNGVYVMSAEVTLL